MLGLRNDKSNILLIGHSTLQGLETLQQLWHLVFHHSRQLSIPNTIPVQNDSLWELTIHLLILPQGRWKSERNISIKQLTGDKLICKQSGSYLCWKYSKQCCRCKLAPFTTKYSLSSFIYIRSTYMYVMSMDRLDLFLSEHRRIRLIFNLGFRSHQFGQIE